MVVALACNSSTWQPKAGRLPKVQGQPEIHREVQVDLELKFVTPYFQKSRKLSKEGERESLYLSLKYSIRSYAQKHEIPEQSH